MRIAVIGTGISGLTAAHLLHPEHELSLFEASDYIGGHTVTTQVAANGRYLAVDAGFIVYNEPNYPNFVRLLERLGVETQPAAMTLSVRCDRTGLEYAGAKFNTLFAQRSNLLRPRFYGLLREISKFNRAASKALGNGLSGTLGEFLKSHNLTDRLAEQYLIPLTAAIWSTEPRQILNTPARFILSFLDNHNLLAASGFHQWRVIRGGSDRYVRRITEPFSDRIRLSTPVRRVHRVTSGVEVSTDEGTQVFDEVILAVHSNQALAMLGAPSRAEREILGAIHFKPNPALLHTDESVLPKRKRAWASWNYRIPRNRHRPVAVTYNMTELQSLPTDSAYCVSLNMGSEVDERLKLRSFDFEHPLFDHNAVKAQQRHREISGVGGLHYCGAYWRNGLHEDGVVSALAVARKFGAAL